MPRSIFLTSLFALAVQFLAAGATADTRKVTPASECWTAATLTGLDVSDGTEVTAEIELRKAAEGVYHVPERIKVLIELTDADNGISNVQSEFTAAETSGGTFGKVPLCADAAPTLTCGAVDLDWDPTTHGKTFWLYPIPWGWPYGKITFTTTGHGAGDEIDATIYGCW